MIKSKTKDTQANNKIRGREFSLVLKQREIGGSVHDIIQIFFFWEMNFFNLSAVFYALRKENDDSESRVDYMI